MMHMMIILTRKKSGSGLCVSCYVQIQHVVDNLCRIPAQDIPFLYTRSHMSELTSCKSIISTDFILFSYLNSVQHISVTELCCGSTF